ncbi:hypothetical protein R2083_06145 [Nitrosomonas sp. Is35]|uniref:hypothetical protein n=1 Tax=Nitrosomonas sp. Is35 TaxID=3080534 RepID=UPI00294AF940|nr:hypothetical protein [Nitrosomonas sp. Is35]MDV6347094.1 hypothetical protein [Nitrosomonas sp. Is35]
MEISASASFWIGMIGTLVGVLSGGIAVYQWAVINEAKKRRHEIQFILAGVGHLVLSKCQSWNNQIALLARPETADGLGIFRVHVSARDDMNEIHSLVTALEGTIDSSSSASKALLQKSIEQAKLNNELQETALKNPTRHEPLVNRAEEPRSESGGAK